MTSHDARIEARIKAAVERVVKNAPPLTDDQRHRIIELLRRRP